MREQPPMTFSVSAQSLFNRGGASTSTFCHNKEINVVSRSSNKSRRINTACGVHAGGQDDYMKNTGPRLRTEEAKLQRRIDILCSPKGALGYFGIVLRRRRLLRMLRARFEVPYAMFLSQGILSDSPTKERRTAEQDGTSNGG